MCIFAGNTGILAWIQAADPVWWRKNNFLKPLLIVATLAAMVAVEPAWGKLKQGEEVVTVTNALWVRLRSTPEIVPRTVLTRVKGGSQLKYLGKQEDWFKVGLPNGREGWLHSEFGRLDSARDSLEVTAAIARVRESRAPRSPVIARAIQGLMLEILQREDDWYRVRLPLGEEGWIRADLVTLHEVAPAEVLSGPLPTDDVTAAAASEPPAQEDPELDESTGVNPLSLTPLPLAASADSTEPNTESSAPTMASPASSGGPSLLTIFLSVFAGLSVFAIFLVVGALAIRKRTTEDIYPDHFQEPGEPELEKPEEDPVYSDPLLGWMDSSSAVRDDPGVSKAETAASLESSVSVELPEEWKDFPFPSAEEQPAEEAAPDPVESTSWEDMASGNSFEPAPSEEPELWAANERDLSREAVTSYGWHQSSPDPEPPSEPEIEDAPPEPEEIEFVSSSSWASEEPEEMLYEPEPSTTEEIRFEPEPEFSPPEPEAAPPENKEATPEPEEKPDSSGVVPPTKASSGNKPSSSRSRKRGRRRSTRRRGRKSGSRKSR